MVLTWKSRLQEIVQHAKDMEPKERFRYLWGYFGGYAIALVALLAVLISIVVSITTQPEPMLQVVMVDPARVEVSDEEAFADFFRKYGHETYEGHLQVAAYNMDEESSTFAETHMALVAMMVGGQDIFLGTGEYYESIAQDGAGIDLRTVLSQEVLDRYADHILYSFGDEETEPYPCAIWIEDNQWLKEHPYYKNGCYFAISHKMLHPEIAKQFAEYVLG